MINIDHLYSKPIEELSSAKNGKPTFKVQLSGSIPSTKLIKQPKSQLIKVDLTVKPENKSIALFKGSSLKQEQTVLAIRNAKLAQTGSNQSILDETRLHPMLCASTNETDSLSLMDTSDVMYSDNLDAELDSILNDHCSSPDVQLLSPASFDDVASPQSDVSSHISASDQLCSIDTPQISDMLDPFDFQKSDSLFSENFSAELFPQLSAVI